MSSGNQPSKNSRQSIQLLLSIKLRWSLCHFPSTSDKVLNGPHSCLFWRDAGSIRGLSNFFQVYLSCFSQKPNIYFKINRAVEFALSRNPPSKTRADSSFYYPPVFRFRYDVDRFFFSLLSFFFQKQKHLLKKPCYRSCQQYNM